MNCPVLKKGRLTRVLHVYDEHRLSVDFERFPWIHTVWFVQRLNVAVLNYVNGVFARERKLIDLSRAYLNNNLFRY